MTECLWVMQHLMSFQWSDSQTWKKFNICNDILRVKISRTIIPWQEQPAPKTTTELITMHDTLCWASSEDLSQVLQLPTLSQSIYSTSQKLCTTVSSVTAHKRILDCFIVSFSQITNLDNQRLFKVKVQTILTKIKESS